MLNSTPQRISLGLEYHGKPFCGWQAQAGRHPNIQEALEDALAYISGSPIRVIAAGRTDTGVHATLQIVHFDTVVSRPLDAWVRGVNSKLPPEITVLWAQPVPSEFHARYCAISRNYTYVLLNRKTCPGLLTGLVGWSHRPLALTLMQTASEALLGEHDFTTFRAAECQAKSPTKNVHHVIITQKGDFFFFHLQANAFLHHMVRNIVASLIYIGEQRRPLDWLQEILIRRNRALAAPTFMPDGLYLTGVTYPAEWQIPENYRRVPFLL